MDDLRVGDVVRPSDSTLRYAREAIYGAGSSRARAVYEIEYEVLRDRLGIIVEVDPSPYGAGYGVAWINPAGATFRDGRPYQRGPFYSTCLDYLVQAAD
jgi:hypothetical protein